MLLTEVLLLLSTMYCSGGRVKRVIHGTRVVGRTGPYDAVRYMVAIGSVHGVPWYTLGFHQGLKATGVYGFINCGGSLLTPAIIQTACHCVATFDLPPFPRRTRINNHWESVRVVYIGINDRFGEPFSMVTRPPVKSIKFFVHKLCVRLKEGVTQQATSYDFGYIKIDPGWISGKTRVPTSNVMFAPIYATKELTRMYRVFLKTPPVCLSIGYGIFDEDDHGRTSDFIRAGWAIIMNDLLCQDFTCVNLTDKEISKYKSWVCTEEFPKHYEPAFFGDSGGPFSCDNAYFGLVSGSLHQEMAHRERRIATYAALFFSLYENALEHRRAFEEELNNFRTDPYVDLVKKVIQGFVGARKGGMTTKEEKLLSQKKAFEPSSAVIQVPSGLILLIARPFTHFYFPSGT